MKSKKKIVIITGIVIVCITIVAILYVMSIRSANEKAFESKLHDPEVLFHGIFNTSKDGETDKSPSQSDDICVYFSNDNINFDEKNLVFGDDKKGTIDGFNYYHMYQEDAGADGDADESKTICYLCRYNDKDGVILLDENNEETGRISFTSGEQDWLGRRDIHYSWISGGKTTPLYKLSDVPYSIGNSYLKSKYYTGKLSDNRAER